MELMKRSFLAVGSLLLMACAASGQTTPGWQWGRRGGSIDQSGSAKPEGIQRMVTDKWGNIYATAWVNQYGVNIDGATPVSYNRNSLAIASWRCDGTRRWVKIMGGQGPVESAGLGVDTLGGVYLAGYLTSTNSLGYFQLSTDSSFGYTQKQLFCLKFDSAGVYKWLRMPQADTVTVTGNGTANKSYVADLAVEGNGNLHLLCRLAQGAFNSGGYVVASPGVHMLRYDRNGSFLGGFQPQIATSSANGLAGIQMVREPKTGRYYFGGTPASGAGNISFGTNSATGPFYLSAYSQSGTLLWFKQSASIFPTAILPRPVLDESGFIYLSGGAYPSDQFNGYTFSNPMSSVSTDGVPFVMKIDSNGTAVWTTAGQSKDVGGSVAAAAVANGVVAITCPYAGTLKLGSFQIGTVMNSGYDTYLGRIDAATGVPLGIDTLKSPVGYDEIADQLVADFRGNFYVGGQFTGQMTVAGQTLTNAGGETDFFIAKFGKANCTCLPAVASFSATAATTSRNVTVTYSGQNTADSLLWNWGDGSTTKVKTGLTSPLTHTYATGGSKNICVQAYGSCGGTSTCKLVQIQNIGISALGNSETHLYPNPAKDFVILDGPIVRDIKEIRVLDLAGRLIVKAGFETAGLQIRVSLDGVAPGLYVLELHSRNVTERFKILVE
jgi:hypothetical protein